MKTRTSLLNLLGVAYGLCWGLIGTVAVGLGVGIPPKGSGLDNLLGSPLAESVFFVTCVATGVPVGLAVTRVCARWLVRGSAWKLLWVAPASLLMGTVLLGLLHATVAETYGWLALGKSLSGALSLFVVYPMWYAVGAFFILIVPVPLAFLTCWHLRRMVHRDEALSGKVWPIKPAARP